MSDIIGNNGRPKRNFTIEQFRNDEDGTIQRRWKERIFSSEVVEVDMGEIYTELLLEEIDLYYADPIKIGNLEFKASVIIKELLPDALIDTELLQPFDFDFYNVVAYSDYCIFNGQTVVDSVTRICEQLEVAYKWDDVGPILREVQIDFLQENKDELLQAHKDELLEEVKEELDRFLKHEDPVEIEIYSRTTSVRRFLNSNGEESFRAVAAPEPQVVEAPKPQATPEGAFTGKSLAVLATDAIHSYRYARDVLKAPFPLGEKAIATNAKYSFLYARDVLKAPFPLGEKAIATDDAKYSYFYAKVVLKAPFPLGEKAIATDSLYSHFYAKVVLKAPFSLGEKAISTDAKYSYFYAKVVLKAPFLLGEKAIATDEYYFKKYKELFPEPQVVEANGHKAFTRRGFVVEEVIEGCKTEGCTAEKFIVNSWEHYGETFNDLTEGCRKGSHSEGDHTEGICPKCGKPVVYKDYFVVTSDAKALKAPD